MTHASSSSKATPRFSVGETVFAYSTELSWVIGTVASVAQNNLYKPLTDAQKSSVVADTLRKKINSKWLYTINAKDPLFLSPGGGEEGGGTAATASRTLPEIEEWNVDIYDESIVRHPVDDLLSLTHLHDGSILRTLAVRYFKNIVYTNIGVIVVAINPFNFNIPHYREGRMADYLREKGEEIGTDKLLPHSWAQAHNTFFEMCTMSMNQSILISGESGAGKTEAAKIVLKYLSAISVTEGSDEEKNQANNIAAAVTACSPILEAFGNAKTVRNDNSSRFGKLLRLKFHSSTRLLLGAFTTKYLLEKSRVITCGKGERLYHAFYLAFKATDASTSNKFTKPAAQYKSLYAGECIENKEFSSTEEYTEVSEAMKTINIAEQHIKECWQIASAVVHACNATFVSDGGEGSKIKDAESETALKDACSLWGVPYAAVLKECTTTLVKVAGETATKLLPVHKAIDVKDALCKAVYGNLFEWLVERCNAACDFEDGGSECNWIALLDIFGFENFDFGNGFEQLCINYANETLQQHYNWCIFTKDMEQCSAEGIDTVDIKFPDLQPTLTLIEKVLLYLDDECSLGTNEDAFLHSITSKFDKKEAAFQKNPSWRDKFAIHQFAGTVIYTVTGWLEKNRDNLKESLKNEFNAETTTNSLSRDLFQCQARVEAAAAAASGGGGNKKNKAVTLGGFFKQQMKDLMVVINSTNPHWIRCVKPHVEKKPLMLDGAYTLRQLEFAGILGTVKIRKAGYPIRFPLATFCKQYVAVKSHPRLSALVAAAGISKGGGETKMSDEKSAALKELAQHTSEILSIMGYKDKKYAQVGKSIVFIKNDAYHLFEMHRRNAMKSRVLVLQRIGRGYAKRLKCFRWVMAMRIQCIGRGFLSRKIVFGEFLEANRERILEMRRIAALQRREQEEKERQERLAFAAHEAMLESERRQIEEFGEAPARQRIRDEEAAAVAAIESQHASLCHELFMFQMNAKLLHQVQPMAVAFLEGCDELSRREDKEFLEICKFHFFTMVDLVISRGLRQIEVQEEKARNVIDSDMFHATEKLKLKRVAMMKDIEILSLRAFYEKMLADGRRQREEAAMLRHERDTALMRQLKRQHHDPNGASSSFSANDNNGSTPHYPPHYPPRSAISQEVYDLASRYNALRAAEERVKASDTSREERRDYFMNGGRGTRQRSRSPSIGDYLRTKSPSASRQRDDGSPSIQQQMSLLRKSLAEDDEVLYPTDGSRRLFGNSTAGGRERWGEGDGGRSSPRGASSSRAKSNSKYTNADASPQLQRSIYASSLSTSAFDSNVDNAQLASSPTAPILVGMKVTIPHLGKGGLVIATQVASSRRQSFGVLIIPNLSGINAAITSELRQFNIFMQTQQQNAERIPTGSRHADGRATASAMGGSAFVYASLASSASSSSPHHHPFSSSPAFSSSVSTAHPLISQQLTALLADSDRGGTSPIIDDPRSIVWCEVEDISTNGGGAERTPIPTKAFSTSIVSNGNNPINNNNGLIVLNQLRRLEFVLRRHLLGPEVAAEWDQYYYTTSSVPPSIQRQQEALRVDVPPTRSTQSNHHAASPSPRGPNRSHLKAEEAFACDTAASPPHLAAGGDGSYTGYMASLQQFQPTFTSSNFQAIGGNRGQQASGSNGVAIVTRKGWAGQVDLLHEMEENANRVTLHW